MASEDLGACVALPGHAWGDSVDPDALGAKNQVLGLPQLNLSTSACCRRCAQTLGCTAWTRRRGGVCLLRRWAPLTMLADGGATAGRVKTPCTEHCLLPDFGRSAPWPFVGGARLARASMRDVPWMALHHRPEEARFQHPPDELLAARAPKAATAAARGKRRGGARVAVCMAGQARTLSHPLVHAAAFEHLLERGRHDLYAVLSTGSDGCSSGCADQRMWRRRTSFQGYDDMQMAPPCELERALSLLRPVRLRLVLKEEPAVCAENFATLQLRSWAACAELVIEAMRGAQDRYDYMFRTRPDVFWQAPVDLPRIAAALELTRRHDVVVTGNDWHMMVHTSQLRAIADMRHADCAPLCNGCKRCPFREIFDDFNEYCIMLNHLAKWRLLHIEAMHPEDGRILHYTSAHPWFKPLRQGSLRDLASSHAFVDCSPLHGAGKLTRWEASGTLKRQRKGTRIVCQSPPLRCNFCGPYHELHCPERMEMTFTAHPRLKLIPAIAVNSAVPRIHQHEAFVNMSSTLDKRGRCKKTHSAYE